MKSEDYTQKYIRTAPHILINYILQNEIYDSIEYTWFEFYFEFLVTYFDFFNVYFDMNIV